MLERDAPIYFTYNPETLRYAPSMMLFFIVIAGAFQLQQEKRQSELKMAMDMLELKNEFIRKIFGRYMSDEVVEEILETPDGINMGFPGRKDIEAISSTSFKARLRPS